MKLDYQIKNTTNRKNVDLRFYENDMRQAMKNYPVKLLDVKRDSYTIEIDKDATNKSKNQIVRDMGRKVARTTPLKEFVEHKKANKNELFIEKKPKATKEKTTETNKDGNKPNTVETNKDGNKPTIENKPKSVKTDKKNKSGNKSQTKKKSKKNKK